jgi:sulfatase maturation enzyme AslB (radical SAM superfamily)
MTVRQMTIDDYESVYSLWTSTPGMGMRSLDDSREGIERFLARNPATCFVAKRSDCNIELSTNGMLLDNATITFLRKHEVRVIVSFDGADKANFEKIRCGANFERICQNAAKPNHAYEDAPLDIAPASYTAIQQDNQKSLVDIVNAVDKLGFRRVGFGLVTGPEQFVPKINQALLNEWQSAYRMAVENELFLELFPTKVGAYVYS